MRKTCLSIILYILSEVLWAQTYQAVDHFAEEEGLSNAIITALLQDHNGYLWIGTNDGLNRFDGYSFQPFMSNLTDSNSLTGAEILGLQEDPEGGLWCLTPVAINYKAPHSGTFRSHFFYGDNRVAPLELKAFALDWRRNVLMVMSEAGLYEYNPQTSSNRLVFQTKKCFGSDPLGKISMVYSPSHESFFVFSERVLLQYQIANDSFGEVSLQQAGSLTQDGGLKGVVPGTERDVLWIYSSHKIWNIDQEGVIKPVRFTSFESDEFLLSINYGADNEFHIATNRALYAVSAGGAHGQCRCEFLTDEVQGERINCFLRIPEGVFWLGTNRGLYQYNEHKHHFFCYKAEELFGSRSVINTCKYDNRGRLWMASTSGEISIVQEVGSRKMLHQQLKKPLLQIETQDGKKDTLLGLTGDGICQLEVKDDRVFSEMLYPKMVQDITSDGSDTLWAAQDSMLIELTGKKEISSKEFPIPKAYRGKVLDMFCLKGKVYLLMRYQVIIFEVKRNAFKKVSLEALNLSVLPSNTCFAMLGPGELALGTTNGIYILYTGRNTNVIPSYIDNLYLKRTVSSIQVADKDRIWVALSTGLFLYDRLLAVVHPFDRYEGLPPVSYLTDAVTSSPQGWLGFAGERVMVTFHPDSIVLRSGKRKPDIVQVHYMDKQQTINRKLYGEDSLTIVSSSSWIGFDCTVLDFLAPDKNYYQYSLVPEGEADRWVNLGNKRTFYESLANNGYYHLKVRTLDREMQWASDYRELVIRVISPFWRTRIAIMGYVILFILVFYLTIYFTTRNLRRRNRAYRERERIARKIEQQKEELSQKNKNITDSITYAKRIQMALMPPLQQFTDKFPDSFILHIPKDIVSGDFYWVNEVDGRTFFAAVDCTGHGVPGAFMSIIGFELFRRITEQEKKKHPAEILNSLSLGFESIFRDIHNFNLRDGMDVALCAVDPDRKVLEFAGAFNPLYLVRDNTISEIKGDRFSVGLNQADEGMLLQEFQGHSIDLKDGDILYIFTDGYADQFGGPEGKKYKYRRFRHLLLALHQLPMQRQVEFLRRSIMDWKGNLDQVDDILVMGVRIKQGKEKQEK